MAGNRNLKEFLRSPIIIDKARRTRFIHICEKKTTQIVRNVRFIIEKCICIFKLGTVGFIDPTLKVISCGIIM